MDWDYLWVSACCQNSAIEKISDQLPDFGNARASTGNDYFVDFLRGNFLPLSHLHFNISQQRVKQWSAELLKDSPIKHQMNPGAISRVSDLNLGLMSA